MTSHSSVLNKAFTGFAALGALAILSIYMNTADAAVFSRDLTVGSEGVDVFNLQKTLNCSDVTLITAMGAGSPGFESTYFGALTRAAVVKFQEAHRSEVLTPSGLFAGTGYVGPATRAALETAFAACSGPIEQSDTTSTTKTEEKLSITSVSPLKATNGDVITIRGTGFSAKGNRVNVMFDPLDRYNNLKSEENGTVIKFTLDSDVINQIESKKDDYTEKQYEALINYFPDTEVSVTVTSDDKTSNFKLLTVEVE